MINDDEIIQNMNNGSCSKVCKKWKCKSKAITICQCKGIIVKKWQHDWKIEIIGYLKFINYYVNVNEIVQIDLWREAEV